MYWTYRTCFFPGSFRVEILFFDISIFITKLWVVLPQFYRAIYRKNTEWYCTKTQVSCIIALLRLETMSLFESEESNGTVSLSEPFQKSWNGDWGKIKSWTWEHNFCGLSGGMARISCKKNRTGQNFRLPEITLTACARQMFLLLTA